MVKTRDPVSKVLTEIFRWLKDKTRESLLLQQIGGGNTPKREYLIKTQAGKVLLEFQLKKNGSGLACTIVALDWATLPNTQRRAEAEREWAEWLKNRNRKGWREESGVAHGNKPTQ